MRTRRWGWLAGLGLAAGLAAMPAQAAGFAPCGDAGDFAELAGSQCAAMDVPLDHARPDDSQRLQLFVRKFPAEGRRRGAIWLVAGGPGESGASFYPLLPTLRRSFPGLDLLVPDHRGTGLSGRLCPDEESVASTGGAALEGAEWGGCFGRLGAEPARARAFSIGNAARDLAGLIAYFRDDGPVYLYGVSYGTQLVLRTLQLGDQGLRGVILDSLVPPETDPRWDLSRRSVLVDAVGRQVLAECEAEPACRGDAEGGIEARYRRVLAAAAQQPAPAWRARLPARDPRAFFGGLLDVPESRRMLPALLADLEAGHDAVLEQVLARQRALGQAMGRYPQSPLSIPLVQIVSASENTLRPELTAAQVEQEAQGLLFTSVLPGLLAEPSLPLYPRDAAWGRQPQKLPPTLVLHGTLDPKTAWAGAQAHAALLRPHGRLGLLAVDGAPHFILWAAPGCFERAARTFVAAGRPRDGRCTPAAG